MSEVKDSSVVSQHEARAKLREDFLRTLNDLHGSPCVILTYEQSLLEATFSGWHTEGSEVLVRDLKTPARVQMSTALLRTPDILAIQFEKSV